MIPRSAPSAGWLCLLPFKKGVRPRVASVLGCVAIFGCLVFGCSLQGEGERCERSNDNNDCESGLQCTSLQSLTGAGEGAVCCPQSNPTTNICRQRTPDLGDDDTSDAPEDAGVTDAGPDAAASE